MSNQVAVLEKFGTASNNNTTDQQPPTLVDSSQSVQALNEVIRYLRTEKDQSSLRAETAENETKRLKSRVDVLEHDCVELESKLNAALKEIQVYGYIYQGLCKFRLYLD
jgi:predicted  nucleic acid-binding Zn-ribbon protein